MRLVVTAGAVMVLTAAVPTRGPHPLPTPAERAHQPGRVRLDVGASPAATPTSPCGIAPKSRQGGVQAGGGWLEGQGNYVGSAPWPRVGASPTPSDAAVPV